MMTGHIKNYKVPLLYSYMSKVTFNLV